MPRVTSETVTEKSHPVRFIQQADKRAVKDTFKIYAAPHNDQRKVQIVRQFAVLSKKTYSAVITLPLGPAYLAAVLEKAGYRVGIIDALGEGIHNFRRSDCGTYNFQGLNAVELIDLIDPDTIVLGVSLMFSQEWPPHREFIKLVRKKFPHMIIVAGGEHPTAMPEYVMRDCPEIDYVVTGEGEMTFLELVYHIFHNKNPQQVAGVSFFDRNDKFISNGLSKRIVQIDELPRPAWHLCKVKNYFVGNWTMGISMGRNLPILGTRGCPYQCTFCSNPFMWTTRYQMRDPKDVVDEIQFLINEYDANSIEFFDLTAIVRKEWISEFCQELERRNIEISWQLPSGTRSEALDEDTLKALKKTGCSLLVYAPESGSEETLKIIKKKLKLPRLNDSIRKAVAIGHTVKINLIIGLPHENLPNVLKTVGYAFRMALLGVEDCNITMFTPYPGTELYYQLRDKGVISEPDDNYFKSLLTLFDLTKSTSYCEHVPGWVLAALRILGLALFYTTAYLYYPKRIVRLIKGLFSSHFQANSVFEQRVYDLIVRTRLSKRNHNTVPVGRNAG